MADYEALLAAEKGKKPEVRPPVDKPQILIKPSQMEKTGKEEINDDGDHDVTTSTRHDVNYRAWNDLIEDTETHNSSLRITKREKFDVEDFIKDLERKHGVKTSLNELARLGMLYLIDDYKRIEPTHWFIKSRSHDVMTSTPQYGKTLRITSLSGATKYCPARI